MLETGIGRAANLALASLPGFTLPGDTSASDRYFRQDLLRQPFELAADGTLPVPSGPGLGIELDQRRLKEITVHLEELTSR
jgi:O-succinylbenzoate synthase